MTAKEWLVKVAENKDALIELIEAYHPASRFPRKEMKITAYGPEAVCATVRELIKAEEGDSNPVDKFNEALGYDDWDTISSVLNGAWFGVPESTDCWQIPGFKEAVDLMEDLPEEAYERGQD